MQEEILQKYEKIKDQLSEEEFLAEIEALRADYDDLGFMNDSDLAGMVLENHGINDKEVVETASDESSEELPFEVSFSDETTEEDDEISSVDEFSIENSESEDEEVIMTEELSEKYEKIKDLISEEDFLSKIKEKRKENAGIGFMNDITFADSIIGELTPEEEIETISENPEYASKSISELEDGSRDANVSGRVISISNPRSFKTRKGGKGEVCNVELQDNTGKIRTVFWTQNMPLLKKFNEGDVIQINTVDIKDGFSGLEAVLRPRSTVIKIEDDPSKYPVYEETITDIADIKPDTKVNIIARIVRIPTVRSYEKNGKEGKVASLELLDKTGTITYTLWNNNVELIENLKLEDGDTVKILQAQSRERNNRDGKPEISLTHWDGRIIKGDYDVPEITQEFSSIGDLAEQNNVSIKGVVIRLQDIKKFIRKTDGGEGQLRNFDVDDSTGSIRVTLWGDDADLPINKGDIVKIIGGDVRFDEWTESGYSMNTNFNTQVTINPENLSQEDVELFENLREQIRPIPIEEIKEIDDDGKEIDIVGRMLSVNDINEFQRDDGTIGVVKSALFSDGTDKVQLSFWNERAQEEYEVGGAYQIENARTRLGMYDVDLNVGSGARVIRLTDEQASKMFIPELSTLEQLIYTAKKIDDVDEDEENLIIIGRIVELNDVREFDRDNGDTGSVRNIEIADDTGSLKVVLWDKDARKDFEMGEPIKLQNPRLSLDMENRIEATVSRSTTILQPSESEIEKLPTYEELKEAIYTPKAIESLSDDDTNVCVTGTISDINTDRTLLKKCPHCNSTINDSGDDEFICDYCGESFDEPKYVLMIPTRIEDDTGDISVTFFDSLAEELVGMKKEEIIATEEEGYGIAGKLEDLKGLTIEIIANVGFDDYNEESRLTPKKILSKYY